MARCFKRYRFDACESCVQPVSLWRRLCCFVRYATWGTDSLPAEHLVGWISTGMGTAVLTGYANIHASHYELMWQILPPQCWGGLMVIIGLSQLITPIFGMVPWVRRYRLLVAASSGFLWSSIASIVVFHLHFIPFAASTTCYAAASWWVFLRTPDSASLTRCSEKKNGG